MPLISSSILKRVENSSWISLILLFMLEFQWFLIVLSVLPSRIWAMSAHLLALSRLMMYKIHSSSLVHGACLLIIGLRWLCHLSLHCFPILPGRWFATTVHLCGPSILTKWSRSLSSISVQGPFTRFGFSTFCHLWRHWTSVLPLRLSAIFFQFLPPLILTASVSFLSSISVQCPFTLLLCPRFCCFWYLVGPLL